MRIRFVWGVVCALALSGCLDDTEDVAGGLDVAGGDTGADAGAGDADAVDFDAPPPDAGEDTGADIGADIADVGAPDVVPTDTGLTDTAADADTVVPPTTTLPRESRGSAVAITSDDKYVAMVNTDDGSVSVFNTATDSLLSRTDVGSSASEPVQLVWAPDDATLYVTLKADGAVARILDADTPDPTPGSMVATGSEPVGLALSPTGRILYVANSADGTVSVIDTVDWAKDYDAPVPGNPWAVAVTNDLDQQDRTTSRSCRERPSDTSSPRRATSS